MAKMATWASRVRHGLGTGTQPFVAGTQVIWAVVRKRPLINTYKHMGSHVGATPPLFFMYVDSSESREPLTH